MKWIKLTTNNLPAGPVLVTMDPDNNVAWYGYNLRTSRSSLGVFKCNLSDKEEMFVTHYLGVGDGACYPRVVVTLRPLRAARRSKPRTPKPQFYGSKEVKRGPQAPVP